MIDGSTFGTMTIEGKIYNSDLKIFPDHRVADNWWRASGHLLTPEDIADLLAAGPEILIVGTGVYGRMIIDSGTSNLLTQKGIELVAEPTEKAARKFNEFITRKSNVAACFHLTC